MPTPKTVIDSVKRDLAKKKSKSVLAWLNRSENTRWALSFAESLLTPKPVAQPKTIQKKERTIRTPVSLKKRVESYVAAAISQHFSKIEFNALQRPFVTVSPSARIMSAERYVDAYDGDERAPADYFEIAVVGFTPCTPAAEEAFMGGEIVLGRDSTGWKVTDYDIGSLPEIPPQIAVSAPKPTPPKTAPPKPKPTKKGWLWPNGLQVFVDQSKDNPQVYRFRYAGGPDLTGTSSTWHSGIEPVDREAWRLADKLIGAGSLNRESGRKVTLKQRQNLNNALARTMEALSEGLSPPTMLPQTRSKAEAKQINGSNVRALDKLAEDPRITSIWEETEGGWVSIWVSLARGYGNDMVNSLHFAGEGDEPVSKQYQRAPAELRSYLSDVIPYEFR